MADVESKVWFEANQRYLTASIARLRKRLERGLGRPGTKGAAEATDAWPDTTEQDLASISQDLPAPAALDILAATFGLSLFEREVLILCAGVELESSLADCCASAQGGDPRRRYPTFGLALAVIPEAHWSALTPGAPLRYWRLIEVGPEGNLTSSPLRIDEWALHFLIGVPELDQRLFGAFQPVQSIGLPDSHRDIAAKIRDVWALSQAHSEAPVVQLMGADSVAKRAIAAEACESLGLSLYKLDIADLPAAPPERDAVIRLWEREAATSRGALLLELSEAREHEQMPVFRAFLSRAEGEYIISTAESVNLSERPTIRFSVESPTSRERRDLWNQCLGPLAQKMNGQIDALVNQFCLSRQAIRDASAEVLNADEGGVGESNGVQRNLGKALWEACRVQARPRLQDLAQQVRSAFVWDDLVLPPPQKHLLRDIAAHVRQRVKVYEDWGFAAKGARGLGITALFAGPSGTGKTMAAEVLANALRLDLFRIDLSTVVSKYIGETEKHLRRIFDAAENGGVILLFDEADALFGKRSEVKDSHDRYANIEVSYLLQRMEAYRGLAILTTNQKSALDNAFLRRIRFVVQFPFPDARQRAEIWRRIFPEQTPTEALDMRKLARLSVAGGNIRNIALNAAFFAADQERPVRMADLRNAAQTEYGKLEKSLSTAETRDWQ